MSDTWRHLNGSVRVDHMAASPGDYFGPSSRSKQLATLASLIQFLTGLRAIECYRIAFRVVDSL